MTQKPEIQYIGQFYVHGSEAKALQRRQKKARTQLPQVWNRRVERIYVDPVALIGIAVAVFMLVVMVLGAVRIRDDWRQYEAVKDYVETLRVEYQNLNEKYHEVYDLEDVRAKAEGMGLVPKDTLTTITIRVTPPEPEAEQTWLDDLRWFLGGLLE